MSASYTKMGFRNHRGWTIQDSTAPAAALGFTFQEMADTHKSHRKNAQNPFSHLPPRFESPVSEITVDDAAFLQYSSGS